MGNWLDAKYCEGLELDLNKLRVNWMVLLARLPLNCHIRVEVWSGMTYFTHKQKTVKNIYFQESRHIFHGFLFFLDITTDLVGVEGSGQWIVLFTNISPYGIMYKWVYCILFLRAQRKQGEKLKKSEQIHIGPLWGFHRKRIVSGLLQHRHN